MNKKTPIIKTIGDWKITKWGLEHDTFPRYEIHRARLWEPDWVQHMNGKNWVNIEIFKDALSVAQKIHGGKKEEQNG